MINHIFGTKVVSDDDRAFATNLQQRNALKDDVGPSFADAAERLAKLFIKAFPDRNLSLPQKVALYFEVEDADDAATVLTAQLEKEGISVGTACFWLHRRKSSFDDVIVDVAKAFIDDIAGANVSVILQPGALRPDAIRAFLVHTSGQISPTAPVVVLTTWSAPDLEDTLESALEPEFSSRMVIGNMADGSLASDSNLYLSSRFSSSQRLGFPSGWDKNDFHPKSVRLAMQKQMDLDRSRKQGLSFDGT
ncbi:hypothetical protein HFO97_27560 [Rhizobium leguminosarum]|uniref:hypothetical protein n=1 Tax=Rhizobium leguminosarum TaxID=384 RepID=UPI001C949152|nr:hypothetical protein [Rhizobium leguminosarum]MBY5363633.1 hypothetical protein [Rhizobium leguminosarum]